MAAKSRTLGRKITARWIRNSFAVIVLLIIVIEIIACISIRNSYYNQTEQILVNYSEITRNKFSQIVQDPTGYGVENEIRSYVASFEERDRMELMLVDMERNITLTSSGFLPQSKSMPDLDTALLETTRLGVYVGKLGTNEKIMAVTTLYPLTRQQDSESSVLAMRLVTSLSRVDKQIATIILGIILLGVAVLLLVLFSSSYFLSTIIRPIGEVGETARKIAQGDFSSKLTKQNEDEIGELADIINYMADELQTSENLKNDFISSVSHELRTPLTAIQGWAETIKTDEGEDKELLSKGMSVIISETSRLSGMVEELLDFSKMQSGRLKLVRGRIDIIAELSEAVLMYTQRAQREGIDLLYDDNEDIAPVYGDKNRLRQVFINVIDNAIKYSDTGATVNISSTVTPINVFITVSDTGIGISEKDLPQIKSKFYKANFTRRGSGIGLAVADEIVARHDGTLSVESKEGQGTTITIALPIYNKQNEITKIDD